MDRVAASTTDAGNHPADIDTDVLPEVDATDTILDGELAREVDTGGHHLEFEPVDVEASSVCPLCPKLLKSISSLWQHINIHHISRGEFPTVNFFRDHSRLVCSNHACHWAYHRRFIRAGCRRSLLGQSKRCAGTLIDPTGIAAITAETATAMQFRPRFSSASPPPAQASCTHPPLRTIDEADLGRIGICAAAALGLEGKYKHLENSIVSAILEETLTTPVSTIAHIPRSVRPLLATVVATELRHAHSGNIWGFVRLQLFAKAVLRSPLRGGRRRRYVVQSLISDRLHRWQDENGIIALWDETRQEPHRKTQEWRIRGHQQCTQGSEMGQGRLL